MTHSGGTGPTAALRDDASSAPGTGPDGGTNAGDGANAEQGTPPPAGWGSSFLAGALFLFEIPSFILAATGAGFGALAKDAGIDFGQAVFLSLVIFATPAQVAFADQVARGAPLVAIAFAVMLTGVRFLPMTVSLMPYLRQQDTDQRTLYVASHFVAITSWAEGLRRLPKRPVETRMPYFLGMGIALNLALLIGTIVGYLIAGMVPAILTSALLFMTPVYFLLSQIINVHRPIDAYALLIGVVLGPVFLLLAPGFDLLLGGLVGGTLAFVLSRRGKPTL